MLERDRWDVMEHFAKSRFFSKLDKQIIIYAPSLWASNEWWTNWHPGYSSKFYWQRFFEQHAAKSFAAVVGGGGLEELRETRDTVGSTAPLYYIAYQRSADNTTGGYVVVAEVDNPQDALTTGELYSSRLRVMILTSQLDNDALALQTTAAPTKKSVISINGDKQELVDDEVVLPLPRVRREASGERWYSIALSGAKIALQSIQFSNLRQTIGTVFSHSLEVHATSIIGETSASEVSGCYGMEGSGSREWQWCTNTGVTLQLKNLTEQTAARQIKFSGNIIIPPTEAIRSGRELHLSFNYQGINYPVTISGKRSTPFSFVLPIAPGRSTITVTSDIPRASFKNELRVIHYGFSELQLLPADVG
jgi:hypothetical protein